MTGDTHYDLETLAELAEGLLDDATAQEVRDHLVICDPCGEALADLAGVREVLAAMPVPAMPLGVALRVDQALAAEAERRQRTLDLDSRPAAPAPDWDRIMRDAPWETGLPWDDEPSAPAEERVADLPPLDTPRLVPLTAASAADGESRNGSVNGSPVKANGSPYPVEQHAISVPDAGASDQELDARPGERPDVRSDIAAEQHADETAEPARPTLGVIAEDGTVVPAKPRTSSARRRRRWLVPLSSAAAAAAVVIGGVSVANNVLVADGEAQQRQAVAAPSQSSDSSPSRQTQYATVNPPQERGPRYVIGQSGYNYADAELKANLVAYFGSMPGAGGTSGNAKLNKCIAKLSAAEKRDPIGIDQAYYNGNEALIMVFWHNRSADLVKVRVVSPECKTLRKPELATWN